MGNPISVNNVHAILVNPFYYGEMKVKGELLPHKYKTLISVDMWKKCQGIKDKSRVSHQVHGEKPFLYRGLITCGQSGKMVSIERKKNKHNYMIYYDESGKKRFYMKEEQVTAEISGLLKKIRFPDKVLQEAALHVKNSIEAEKSFYEESVAKLKKEDLSLTRKLKNLLDLRLEDEISKDEYEAKKAELKTRQKSIQEEIGRHQNGNESFAETVYLLMASANKFHGLFTESSNDALKRQLLNFAVRTFTIDAGKVRISLRQPFQYFSQNSKNANWLGC